MPLASILRPKTLDDFIGQSHLVGPDGPLRSLISSNQVPSMIFWGPPASGKTTLAQIIANNVESDFITLSAVTDGKEDLRKVISKAKENKAHGRKTILFIDEIHRWSKAQQDGLLPFVENGEITLIGATTENPSFTVISPLLSRSRVFIFNSHNIDEIVVALKKGVEYLNTSEERHALPLHADDETLKSLAEISNGDIRFALNSLEIAAGLTTDGNITKDIIEKTIQKTLRYDRNGEEHYNIISAVHKSLRSSNATAAVYWIMRMLETGEDPLYIARRLIRFASEDIGNANPNALLLANVVYDTCHKIGMPECNVALAQLAQYLANSKKDNSAYTAIHKAKEDIKKYGNLPVPLHFRNAPTKLMKEIGYGKDYQYDHDLDNKKSNQQCMPDRLKNRDYFADKESVS
jgi:putative ATPase